MRGPTGAERACRGHLQPMERTFPTRGSGIALVVADMDGTLLTSDKQLTPRTALAVRHLRREGIHFGVATNRPPFGMRPFLEALEITTPLICCGGAVLARPDTLEVIEQRCLPEGLVLRLLEVGERFELDPRLFRYDSWFVPSLRDYGVGREIRGLGEPPIVVPDVRHVANQLISKLTLAGPMDAIHEAQQHLQEIFGNRLRVVRSESGTLDLLHPAADKGVEVARLARTLNLPLSRVAVIGDAEGDISMLRIAGLAIAMANAPVTVRREAHRTAPSNAADGVAAALNAWILPVEPLHLEHPAAN